MSDQRFIVCDQPSEDGRFPLSDDIPFDVAASVNWLYSAEATRAEVADNEHLKAVWVRSCDLVAPINLAAALKADRESLVVYLVSADKTGSVASRAQAASIDEVVGLPDFPTHLRARVQAMTAESAVTNEGAPDCPEDAMPAEFGVAPYRPSGFASDSLSDYLADTACSREGESESPLPMERFSGCGSGALSALPPSGDTACVLAVPTTTPIPVRSRAGFLLTVVSGSGGTGKSTVATLAALLGAKRGLRTVLFDADLQFGDVARLVGPCAQVSIEDVAKAMALPATVAEESFVLVRAPHSLEQSEAVAGLVGDVADLLAGHFDLVVVNTGGSWSEQHAVLLERSAATLFLIDQRASSVRACRHALELCLRCGIATGSFLFAVNRCTRHAPFSSIDVSSALSGAHVVELADGGSEIEELLGAGLAERLIEGANPLCASIARVLDELLPRASGSAPGVEAPLARVGLKGDRGALQGRGKRKGRRGRRDAVMAEG